MYVVTSDSVSVECPICDHVVTGVHSVAFVFANAGCAACLANSHPVFTPSMEEIEASTMALAEIEESGRPQPVRSLKLLDPSFDDEEFVDITLEVEHELGL